MVGELFLKGLNLMISHEQGTITLIVAGSESDPVSITWMRPQDDPTWNGYCTTVLEQTRLRIQREDDPETENTSLLLGVLSQRLMYAYIGHEIQPDDVGFGKIFRLHAKLLCDVSQSDHVVVGLSADQLVQSIEARDVEDTPARAACPTGRATPDVEGDDYE